jgi:hypothetical protein
MRQAMTLNAARGPFVIVDNNLLDDRGHHLALARTLTQAALAHDRPVVWYTHRKFRAQRCRGITVRRFFPMSTYEPFAIGKPQIDLSSDFTRVFEDIDRRYSVKGASVLIHTADAHVFRALDRWAQAAASKAVTTELILHICTCYELGLMPGSTAPGSTVGSAISSLARSSLTGNVLFLWAETERLAAYYHRAFHTCVLPLSLPAPQWIAAEDDDHGGCKLCISFLGAAREEKGFTRIPELARAIQQVPGLGDRVVLRVQCSEPLAGYNTAATQAIVELRSFPFVELLYGVLDVERYAAEVHRADVILMMYNAENYIARGSGIVTEALCSGKYVLYSAGMFVDAIEHHGLGLRGRDIPDWVAHIIKLVQSLKQARATARGAGKIMREHYDVQKYLSRLKRRVLHSVLLDGAPPTPASLDIGLLVQTNEPSARY